MLRDISNITVKHQDGEIETVSLPEDIGSELFQAGAFPAFGMRMKNASVQSVESGSGAEKAGILPEDILYSVNQEDVTYFDQIQSLLYSNKGDSVDLCVLRTGDNQYLDTMVLRSAVDKDGKIGLAAGVTDKLVNKYDAVKFVKTGSEIIGGKGGGGRADFAQAGGTEVNKIDDAISKLKSLV